MVHTGLWRYDDVLITLKNSQLASISEKVMIGWCVRGCMIVSLELGEG